MQLVINNLLTLTDESAQAAHGNPIALFSTPAISFFAVPHSLVRIDGTWTSPAAIVQNWLDKEAHSTVQTTFAQTFLNPLFRPPSN